MNHYDGVTRILGILRGYFAPEAADAIYQQVVRFVNYRGSDQSISEYITEYDLLRRQVGSKMAMGAGFPEQICPHFAREKCGVAPSREILSDGKLP